jgi:hypothetical protein
MTLPDGPCTVGLNLMIHPPSVSRLTQALAGCMLLPFHKPRYKVRLFSSWFVAPHRVPTTMLKPVD